MTVICCRKHFGTKGGYFILEKDLHFQKIYALHRYLKKSKMAKVCLLPYFQTLCHPAGGYLPDLGAPSKGDFFCKFLNQCLTQIPKLLKFLVHYVFSPRYSKKKWWTLDILGDQIILAGNFKISQARNVLQNKNFNCVGISKIPVQVIPLKHKKKYLY